MLAKQLTRLLAGLLAGHMRQAAGVAATLGFALAGLTLASTVVSGCRQEASTPKDAHGLHVYVSIPPQRFFVERIGGGNVAVSVLLPPGQSPATFEPTSKQITALADADVYFRIGVPFERHVVARIRGALSHLNIVDTEEGLTRNPLEAHHHNSPQHHDGTTPDGRENAHKGAHENNGGELDPHIWMSPVIAKDLARRTADALCQLDPPHAQAYRDNLAKLIADLDQLHTEISSQLSASRGMSFYVFHPAYGYFANAYGLKQVAIESGGQAPTAKGLGDLIQKARAQGAKILLVQPQFDRSNAELIAREIHGSVVAIDPLAEDYLANLRHMAKVLQRALASDAGSPHSSGVPGASGASSSPGSP